MSVYLSFEELKDKFEDNKRMIDEAYMATKERFTKTYSEQFGEELGKEYARRQADIAIKAYFVDYETKYITNRNGSRTYLNSFKDCMYQNQQILLDYAISSYMLNKVENDVTEQELSMYASDLGGKLNYDPDRATKIVALATAINPFWASQLIAINKNLKSSLVDNFIRERYVYGKAQELDDINGRMNVYIGEIEGRKGISKNDLNLNIQNMMNQDEEIFFDKNNLITNSVSYGSR